MAEVSLTVTIHKTEKRVLWAETDKNFVDFLFCLFSLPMGHILNLMNDDDESVGCLRNIYQSVHLMAKDFMVCDKNDILKPKVHLSSIPCLLKLDNFSPTTILNLFTCHCQYPSFSTSFTSYYSKCSFCKRAIDNRVTHYVTVPDSKPGINNDLYREGNGFVKGGMVKYIVTDDFSVTPSFNFSSLAYLKTTMHIVDLEEVEEKVVNVNVEKCKELLKLVLTSKHMVLTNLFKDEVGF